MMPEFLVSVDLRADLTIEAEDEKDARERAKKWADLLDITAGSVRLEGVSCNCVSREEETVHPS